MLHSRQPGKAGECELSTAPSSSPRCGSISPPNNLTSRKDNVQINNPDLQEAVIMHSGLVRVLELVRRTPKFPVDPSKTLPRLSTIPLPASAFLFLKIYSMLSQLTSKSTKLWTILILSVCRKSCSIYTIPLSSKLRPASLRSLQFCEF